MQTTERERGLDGLTILSGIVLVAVLMFVGRDGVSRALDRVLGIVGPLVPADVPAGDIPALPAVAADGATLPDASAPSRPAPAAPIAPTPLPAEQQERLNRGGSWPGGPLIGPPAPEAASAADAPTTLIVGPGDNRDAVLEHARQKATASGEPVSVEDGNVTYTVYPNQAEPPALVAAESTGRIEPAPTPEPAVDRPAADPDGLYRVVRGDTLYDIARRHGTTVEALMAVNHLRRTTIYSGQRLRIPEGIRQPASPLQRVVPWYPTPAPRVYVEPNWAAAPVPTQAAEVRTRIVEQVTDPSRLLSQGWVDPRCGVIMSCGGPAKLQND